MPTFAYSGRTRGGQNVNGERAADSMDAAVAALRRDQILVPTPAIRNLIRDDKVHQIYGSMQGGQAGSGMQTANQSLASLYQKGLITLDVAMWSSSLKDELQDLINRGVGVVAGAGMAPRPGMPPRPPAR